MQGYLPTQEEYLESILSDLDSNGFDTSKDSNIYKILKEVSKYNYQYLKNTEELIKNHSFDDKTGEELDKFYNFFGIPRIIKTSEQYSTMDFINSGREVVTINVGTTIEKDGVIYKTASNQRISNNETKEIFLNKIENGVFLSKNIVLLSNGIKIDLNGIKISNLNVSDYNLYLMEKCNVANINDKYEQESDVEYISRAKNLIQYYGDGNIEKIKKYIKGIENVSDVIIESSLNETKLIIIPTEVNLLDKIFEQAQEAVDYFKSSHVVLVKPSITEFYISNLISQIPGEYQQNLNDIINGITLYLEEFFKTLYYEDKKEINSETIFFYINKFLIDNSYEISISEKELSTNYKLYSGDDYTTPLLTNTLEYRKSKKISSDIVTIKGVE